MKIGRIQLPEKLVPVFTPARGEVLYRTARGGRGSGKSFNFAKMAAVWGYVEPIRVLCCREFQASIKESFHAELKAAIASEPWLERNYDVGVDYLRGLNGTEFLFRGLRHSINTVRSLAKIDLTIVEEAEDVPEVSWLALEATVFRQPKSELWSIWNPRLQGSPVDERFVKHPPENSINVEMNWSDNPFFPVNLDKLRRREQERLDPDTYHHIWDGGYLTNSKSQVYGGKWRIQDFVPGEEWHGPYQGGDFGFSQDPLAAVRVWIHGGNLYVEYEAGKVSLELDDVASFVGSKIPGFHKYTTRWDNARPESISHIMKHGLPNSVAVEKWKGSVEDGVAFIRSFKDIIIHPRCVETIKEMRLYSHKKDRLTQDILPDIVDAFNHYMDAIRYSIAPLIKRAGYSLEELRRAVA